MDAALFPVGTYASSHGIEGLDPNSYTAHKLKHASPEHLHTTTQRFFIGPIPEGWLNSNRKSWYKRRLELSSYSSKTATFTAASGQTRHQRTTTGLDRSMQARMSLSFPQPEDIEDSGSERGSEAQDTAEDEDDENDGTFYDTTELEPVSTEVQQPTAGGESAGLGPAAGGPSEVSPSNMRPVASSEQSPKARGNSMRDYQIRVTGEESDAEARGHSLEHNHMSASNTATSSLIQSGFDGPNDTIDAGSRTALLPERSSSTRPPNSRDGKKSLKQHEPAPMTSHSNEMPPQLRRGPSEGVRFKITEAVADRQKRVEERADRARNRVGKKVSGRQTLQEGTIVKMEKMLVKVDVTMQQVPDNFDENSSMQLETKTVEKWREFMVVARKSKKSDEDDFRLQFWKTRVIPEIDNDSSGKKPTREIKLVRKSTHVNLYSSLDKTVVIWHPYKKGARIVVMKTESTAHSVEWYSFLRDALGWRRLGKLQVSVPDLGVSLQIDKPFENLEKAGMDEEDEEMAIKKVEEAEQAVAGKIISQCIDMLEGNPEWTSVVHQWHENYKPGLVWKRYDRLEWIHGVNEQKMYGSMAMQHSYELELRPKVHYPQQTSGWKGKEHDEPPPVEGFLIRMTSQKGIHRRMGKTFFKRLYFHTQDNFLIFNRPAAATPPHPPRLQTIARSDIPSASEIVEKTPMMFEIEPFPLDNTDPANSNKQIKWLASHQRDRIDRADREAFEEARRNLANLTSSDGYINLTRIRKVRKMHWGTDEADETLDSGSDVDFHESVQDTHRYDGTTDKIDDDRIFELILDNGLVVRMQAYNKQTRDEWISRLRALAKYWKLRKTADLNTFKAVRATNLQRLNIDEDIEAELGQFGHKWEVTRSEASPQLYNICSIASCRTITLSGLLYRKPRRHGTFHRCGVILTGGKMLVYQSTLRKSSGAQVPNIHQDKQEVIDLRGSYVYSGLVVEEDLLYQNRTFDANHMGTMASLPRVWTEDGWTSSDVDSMTCFVIWQNRRKGWFRTAGGWFGPSDDTAQTQDGQGQADGSNEARERARGRKRAKLKRVRQLGVPGRGMVFKCRSRAERDLWVLNLGIEIERLVERQKWEDEEAGGEVRLAG
ncbi:hypothetical protein H2198_001019 [Neophaeococcomyces mojaviensis]|uniref:Uncharacterized protein n=1 Tax=Neophaeococcomyces mojaviensis TaxID=3383035 RepID=A0ACC3AI48_9EURO|nr:hypothetical protein H2198_001019 [Knufia sp. JES_112]